MNDGEVASAQTEGGRQLFDYCGVGFAVDCWCLDGDYEPWWVPRYATDFVPGGVRAHSNLNQ